MDVHVGEAGDEKFSGGVDDAGAGGDFDGGVWAYGGEFLVIDEGCGVGLGRGAGGVDYGYVGDGDGGGDRFMAGGGEKKKKQGDCKYWTNGFRHICIVAE